MTRVFLSLAMTSTIALVSFGCSDELPPLPDSGVQEDGATHDGQPTPDRGPRDDGQPPPDMEPLPDAPGACFDNGGCDDASYCEIPQGCQGPGRCVPRPDTCPTVEAPVCGCDNQDYGNACSAAAAGVNVAHEGACIQSTCTGAVDCLGHEFCNLDYHCGATPSGVGSCEPTPTGCFDVYDPVCGCDNQDYGNACEAHMAGVSVLHDGTCNGVTPDVCSDLEATYAQLLAQAKICSMLSGPQYACSKEVGGDLFCGCPTFVAEKGGSTIAEMEQLKTKWVDEGCADDTVVCSCVHVSGGSCQSSPGGNGVCVDLP